MRRTTLCIGLGGAIACALASGCTEDVRLGPSGSDGSGGSKHDADGGRTSGGSTGTGGSGGGGGSGRSGSGGTSGEGGGEPPCDTSASPSEDRCVVSDEHAVFVASNGNDENAGTMAEPVATFERALELAARDQKVVIACSGTYEEPLRIITQSVRVYGGFACTEGWRYAPEARSLVEPAETGYALEIRNAPGPVAIEDVDFKSKAAELRGESSVAGIVAGQESVVLRRVRLEAQNGADGENGTLTPFVFPTAEELAGNDASGTVGGAEKRCTCPGDAPLPFLQTHGGKGGDAAPEGQSGGDSECFLQVLGPCGKGGTPGTCNAGDGYGAGISGAGPSPAPFYGTLTSSGWMPSKGGDGMSGHVGDGGGGGSSTATGGGGGGGCGGCGGAGGMGGRSGGASITLIVIQASVAIFDSELVAGDAGDGGNGADGQSGQEPGGVGGAPGPGACFGGSGGRGGSAHGGAGGHGGLSVGVLWMGSIAPELTDTSIETGDEGGPGMAAHGNYGESWGVSTNVLEAGPDGATAVWSCDEVFGEYCSCSFGIQPPTDPCEQTWSCCYSTYPEGGCDCRQTDEASCVALIEEAGGTRVDTCPP